MSGIAVPPLLRKWSGKINDVDSHEMMPAQEWVRHFGPEVRAIAEANAQFDGVDQNHSGVPEYRGDVLPIDAGIGLRKGPGAPGATDPQRRLEVMDALGVKRQLMFPGSIGLFGFFLLLGKKEPAEISGFTGNEIALGKRWLQLYREWIFSIIKLSDRVRPVIPVYGDTPEELIADARYLIDNGVRAVWMASGFLPGGRSPAHVDLDPFWGLLAESGTPATLHGGGEGQFLQTREWKNAPAFAGYRSSTEFDFDPWSMSIYHLPSQNFVTTMVMGGVFERHANLRFGAIEVGSHWVGPMMENMDMLHKSFKGHERGVLKRLPSEYVRSNVRVGTLFYEDIDLWMERYPIEDVLCFGSDYPHVEGGRNALELLSNRLARLGDGVLEKFFVTNGELLLP